MRRNSTGPNHSIERWEPAVPFSLYSLLGGGWLPPLMLAVRRDLSPHAHSRKAQDLSAIRWRHRWVCTLAWAGRHFRNYRRGLGVDRRIAWSAVYRCRREGILRVCWN